MLEASGRISFKWGLKVGAGEGGNASLMSRTSSTLRCLSVAECACNCGIAVPELILGTSWARASNIAHASVQGRHCLFVFLCPTMTFELRWPRAQKLLAHHSFIRSTNILF